MTVYRYPIVKGSKLILQRGEETRIRAKNHVKFVGKRPKELEIEPKKDELTAQKMEKPHKKSDLSKAGKKPDRKTARSWTWRSPGRPSRP